MIIFDVVTLFPQLIEPHLKELPFKKAISKNLVKINLVNLREFALDSYGTVDGEPYGGGVGMILMIEPIFKALQQIPDKEEVIVMSAGGETYNQNTARELSAKKHITLICGRYEGIDARIEENLATKSISVGNYVLSGGELPALTVMESIIRLLPGVLEKAEASEKESFSQEDSSAAEYPQYTRPENFMDMQVPKILLSGNHKEIEKWRKEHRKKI